MESQKTYPTLEKWRILCTLGRGVVKVKRAVNLSTGLEAAIKLYRFTKVDGAYKFPKRVLKDGALTDIWIDREVILENLRQEAAIIDVLQKKKNPHIIQIYEFHESTTYHKRNGRKIEVTAIVMELARGGELIDYLNKNDKLSHSFVRHYFLQFISALECCHKSLIAHRDIKPQNIVFDTNYTLKLIDFGHATFLSASDGTVTDGRICGSQGYIAPEMLKGMPGSGAALDVFSAGIVLFNMLLGIPFRSASMADPHYKCLTTGDLKKYWSSTDPKNETTAEARDLIQKMLALDPLARPSAEEIKLHGWCKEKEANLDAILEEFERRLMKFKEKKRKEEVNKIQQKFSQMAPGDLKNYRSLADFDLDELIQNICVPFDPEAKRELKQFASIERPATQFMVAENPDELLKYILVKIVDKEFVNYTISSKDYKVKGEFLQESEVVELAIVITRVDELSLCVEFQKISGDDFVFYDAIEEKFKPALESINTFIL